MKKKALCLSLLACLVAGGQCRSSGAPDSACSAVSPSHYGSAGQSTPVPYVLSGLPNGNYTTGMAYTLTISGMNNEMFRGFLVVAWNGAGQRVGSFTAMSNSRTACGDTSGITHTNNNDKSSVSFTWTAPPQGTGTVTFRFAVVQVVSTFWANQMGPVLEEAQPQLEPTSTSAVAPSTSSVAPSTSSVAPSTSSVASSTSSVAPSTSSVAPSTSSVAPSTSSVASSTSSVAPSTSSDMDAGSSSADTGGATSSDTTSPTTSSATDGGASSTASSSPSPSAMPGGSGGNSAPSKAVGSLATILLAAAAFVMVAAFV